MKGFVFRVIYVGAAFLIGLLIARLTGTAVFGIISLMIVNAAFFQIITGLGTDSSIVWHGITAKPGDSDKIFSFTAYSFLLQLVLFGTVAVIYFFYTGKTILSGGQGTRIFCIESVYFTGLVLTEKYSALYYSQQQAGFCNKLLAASVAVLLAAVISVMFFFPDAITDHPMETMAIVTIIPAIVLIVVYHITHKPGLKKPGKSSVISFAGFSLIVFITNLIQFLAYRIDFWVIDYYHGKAEVGIYAQAAKFSQMLWILPAISAGLIIPTLKKSDKAMSVAELLSVCRLLLFSHIIFAAILVGGSYILYQYFLPVDFVNGFSALLLMLPGYLLFVITTVLAAYYSANRLLKVNLQGSVICLAIMLSADLLLIPRISYSGAAIANTIAYAVTTFFFIYITSRRTGTALGDYLIIRKSDFKILKNESVPEADL